MIVIFVIGEIITSALWCDEDCQAVARLRFHPFWWQRPFVFELHLSNKHLPVREITVFQIFSSYFLHLLRFWVQVEFAMTLLTDWDSFGDSKWLGTHPWASRFGSFCFTLSLSCICCCQGDDLKEIMSPVCLMDLKAITNSLGDEGIWILRNYPPCSMSTSAD